MFLTEIPANINIHVNFWLWLLPVVAPILIFCVRVERSMLSYILRVICAIGLTYVLLNLALHTKFSLERIDYHNCRENSGHPYMSTKSHRECSHHLDMGDGPKGVVALGFGWVPSAFYVGIWESLWRIRHRKKIREMGKKYKGKWFSYITISLMAIPFILYFLLWLNVR